MIAPRMLLALDPSVRSPGAALFMNGRLIAAGRVRISDICVDGLGARWLETARAIYNWAFMHGMQQLAPLDCIVFERPQIYRAVKSKGDPNDLIGLAGVSMALVGLCRGNIGAPLEVCDYTPAEWIGQIKKTTTGSAKTSPRAQRILSRLDAAELAIVPDQHDAIDAVGLCLHRLGRLGIRRVYSNGSDQG